MTKKKPGKWSQFLVNLLFVIPSAFNIVRQAISCVEEDVRIARKSLISIIILSFLAVIFLLSAWLCLCLMGYLCLLGWAFTPLASLSILLVTHLILLLFISLMMIIAKDKLLFHHTRDLFHH